MEQEVVAQSTVRKTRRLPPGITLRSSLSGEPAYQVRVRKAHFPTFSKTFDRLEEAKAWKAAVETKLNRGEAVASAAAGRISIAEALKDYAAHGDEVTDQKRYTLGQIAQDFGTLSISNLTPTLLKKWLAEKRAVPIEQHAGKRHPLYDGGTQKFYSDGSMRKFYYALKTALEWHSRFHSYPLQNPFDAVKPPVEDNNRTRRLEAGEEEQLMTACDKMYVNQEELKRVIRFALETAMRAGEILKLEWHEIDYTTRSIYIPKEKCKTKRSREIPITGPCLKLLKQHEKATRNADESRVFWMWKDSDRLGHRFKVVMKNAAVKNFRFHDLRHEATSRFFQKSTLTDIEIALITGHTDLRTLKRYTHLRPNSLLKKMW